MSRIRFIGCVVAVIGVSGACGDDAGVSMPTAARSPVPAPDGEIFDLTLSGGDAFLVRLRSEVGQSRLRFVVPSRIGELFERVSTVSAAVGDDLDPSSPFIVIGILGEAGIETALAVRAVSDSAVTTPSTTDRGPHGSQWIGPPPARAATALVRMRNVLVAASNREALSLALPYLVDRIEHATDSEPGLRLELREGWSSHAQRLLGGVLDEQVRDMRVAAAEERARHESPPTLGEPEVLISIVENKLRGWLELLGGVGEAQTTFRISTGLALTIEINTPTGSVLREAVEALPALDGPPASIPTDAVGAWWSTQRQGDCGFRQWSTMLSRVAQDRLLSRDQLAVDRVTDSLCAASGSAAIYVLGGGSGGMWGAWLNTKARGTIDLTTLRTALGTRYASTRAGELLGCGGPLTVSMPREGRMRLCSTPDGPEIVAVGDASTTQALALVDRQETGNSLLQFLTDDAATGPLWAPATEGNNQPIAMGLLVPDRLTATLGQIASPTAPTVPDGPLPKITAVVSTTTGAIRIEIASEPNALDSLVRLTDF